MTTFEYKILEAPAKGFFGGKVDTQPLTDKLNEPSRLGWEVVATSETNMYEGASRNLFVLLKKEKADGR